MKPLRHLVHAFLLVSLCPTLVANDVAMSSPADLVRQVANKELADRAQKLKWMYHVEKREGQHMLTQKQVETKNGPVFRLVAVDRKPLTPEQAAADGVRLENLLHDTRLQRKLKSDYEDDELKLQKLMYILPGAFLFQFDSREGNLVTLRFRPNPHWQSPTYETRIAQQLIGTVVIDARQTRLVKLSGVLAGPVDFGYGLLGHVEKGGTVEIVRTQVAPDQWKTALINIQMAGRVLLFKTLNKQQYETRSEFVSVPSNLTLREGWDLLSKQPEWRTR